jgi:hypothetical protein
MANVQTMSMAQAKAYLARVSARPAGKDTDGSLLFKTSAGVTLALRRGAGDTVTVQTRMDGCAC